MSTVTEKIDAKLVKELREKSGAPMGDCLKALQESKGEMEAAFVILRKRGMASAQKKASRSTNEGAVGHYIHAGGKIGVIVEVNCESDFVARTEDFQELLKDIAMHIAATDPRYIRREDVTEEDLAREKDIYRAQAAATGKPAPVIDGFSGDQRVLLGWAQAWRGKVRDDFVRKQVVSDQHSPRAFRVIGPTRNIDEWYAAFGVEPGEMGGSQESWY